MVALILAALAIVAADQAVRLPTGWRMRPAGRQTALDTFPAAARFTPDRRHVLILHSGYKQPSLRTYTPNMARMVSEAPTDAWPGMAVSTDGARVYVGGGFASAVFEFNLRNGHLSAARTLRLNPRSFVGDIALSADGNEIYVAEMYHDRVAVLSTKSGELLRRFPTGRRPYRVVPEAGGKHLLIACFVENRVERRNAKSGEVVTTTPVSAGPADLVRHAKKGLWYVAGSNSNYVDVLREAPQGRLEPVERINVSLRPEWRVGMTPAALALDRRGERLLVTCSDANAVAVVDLRGKQARVEGFVPTGWYPTSALFRPDGGLLVLNAKGERSFPNPEGPNPMTDRTMLPQPPSRIQYVGLLQTGTARMVEPWTAAALKEYTRTVLENVPRAEPAPDPERPLPPVRNVIYIMKENRTYDQVLGDLPIGNAEPSLCLFPEKVTPNHHKLAREFTLFDNFYVNADVSAEGWFWTSAAIAPPFVMRTWPSAYGGRRKPLGVAPDREDARPPGGYIWTRALAEGLTFRNYGFFVNNKAGARVGSVQLESVSDPALAPHSNPYYAGYDPGFPDIERARIFLRDLAGFEESGNLPRLITMVLPNDHTFGTSPGMPSPISSMADNDVALGMIVEGVSRSRFWRETAIFVVEDDAQNGPDHVDSHRSIAYVLSPYTRRRFVDSRFYNTTSMLRTIELMLGLEPLTHYDATAQPFFAAFQGQPDLAPYVAEKPRVSLEIKNPPRSGQTLRSDAIDLSKPDRVDDAEMNRILWLSVKGTEPPPPVRSLFAERR